MKLRILSSVLVLVFAVGALVPSALAQKEARVDVKMEWEVEHDHRLGESGRDIMKAKVTVIAGNFTCTNQANQKPDYKIRGELIDFNPPLTKWAGASMRPKFFSVSIPNGNPTIGGAVYTKDDVEPTLDIAWDVETRPMKGATFTYAVVISNPRFDGQYGTPQCVTEVGPKEPKFYPGLSQKMKVYMDDVVENVNGTCDVNTDPDKCLAGPSTSAGKPAEAPLIDTTLLMGGIVSLAVVLRRRRNA
ncbi:MAG: hypothetical protein HYT80_09785 [Euryarchaeota archaeon]|nr:hypothetical protein [Euryarchaeota archaeon]